MNLCSHLCVIPSKGIRRHKLWGKMGHLCTFAGMQPKQKTLKPGKTAKVGQKSPMFVPTGTFAQTEQRCCKGAKVRGQYLTALAALYVHRNGIIGGAKYRNAPGEIGVSRGLAPNDWTVQMHEDSTPSIPYETIKKHFQGLPVLGLDKLCVVKKDLAYPFDLGYVYLIRSGNAHKIGLSKNPIQRIADLSRSNPESIQIIHVVRTHFVRRVEWELHELFRQERIHGEWFLLSNWQIASAEMAMIRHAAEYEAMAQRNADRHAEQNRHRLYQRWDKTDRAPP